MRNYEILNIAHLISGLGAGGAERTLVNLVTSDTKHRHYIIYFSKNTFFLHDIEKHNIKTFYLSVDGVKSKFLFLFRLYFILRSTKFDVLQTWMYHADSLGAFVRIFFPKKPLLWNVRNSQLIRKGKLVTNFLSKFNALLSAVFPSGIVYCADQARVDHEKLGYRRKVGHVIPNGVNTKTFNQNADFGHQIRKKYFLSDDGKFNFGYVARFDRQKDFSTLFAAFRIVASREEGCRLVLVGLGCDASNEVLVEMLEKNSILCKTTLLGRVEIAEGFYSLFDVLVLCSRYGEGFPNVVGEAMASGIPCIATDSGDVSRIIGREDFLSPEGNQFQLAENMLRVYHQRDSEIFYLEKKRARERIEALFSLDRMVEGYHALWESFTAKSVSSVSTGKR